jgi:hypothetical protein
LAPLLFLDFDGVLHPCSAGVDDHFCRTSLLADALAGSHCRVVISSSWRHHFPLRKLLSSLPMAVQRLVVGATGAPHVGRWPRYNEICTYVRLHSPGSDWRALDDSWIEFPRSCPELIACDPNVGLALAQAEQLRHWLRAGDPHCEGELNADRGRPL